MKQYDLNDYRYIKSSKLEILRLREIDVILSCNSTELEAKRKFANPNNSMAYRITRRIRVKAMLKCRKIEKELRRRGHKILRLRKG